MSFSGFKMGFPIIRVRDNCNGHEHIVGTNSHDSLHIDDSGKICYYNMQNGEGAGISAEFGYSFSGKQDGCPEEFMEVEFVSLDGLMKIIKEHAGISAKREKLMRESFRLYFEEFDKETDISESEGFSHS